jgi:hypothetical protein
MPLSTESLSGEGVWVHNKLTTFLNRSGKKARIAVWFDRQLLGDGQAYLRRAKEFSRRLRRELRKDAMETLKILNRRSFERARPFLEKMKTEKKIEKINPIWIVNGFTATLSLKGLADLKKIPGVRKIFFLSPQQLSPSKTSQQKTSYALPHELPPFDPDANRHPWYSHYLQAIKTWKELGVTGKGILNVVHDLNFLDYSILRNNVYVNPGEVADNGKDDDGNGLVDDMHGYDFSRDNGNIFFGRKNHGIQCAAIICGRVAGKGKDEYGLAPESRWSGVIGSIEPAVQWALEQGADTYSMSFSVPGLGEVRSHWRKLMEQASLCGLYFASGAGNFALPGSKNFAAIPEQMRVPEDIPEVVFAAAGLDRFFYRPNFSSQGPVLWETEHYHEGKVQKPEVTAFNAGLPAMDPNGRFNPSGPRMNGNSFAGPMFCASIALMLSADPDLLPWDLKKIITSTATDVEAKGVDYQSGYGLINIYRAVKQVLYRKALREGKDPSPYEDCVEDEIDIEALRGAIKSKIVISKIRKGSQAEKLGLKKGDVLLAIDGVLVVNKRQFLDLGKKNRNNRSIIFTLKRGGEKFDVAIKRGRLGASFKSVVQSPVFW